MRAIRHLAMLWIVVAATLAAADVAGAQELAPQPARADDVELLRIEVERLRALVERQERVLAEMERRLGLSASGDDEAPEAEPQAVAEPQPDDDALRERVDDLARRWGHLRLTGDIQFRYEGFYNQGFDAPAPIDARNRLRMRLRAQLSGRIDEHFDWGVRLASGSFTNPISAQQSLTDFYARKPIAIDRAFLRYDTKTEGVRFEVVAGKFQTPWKHTPVTFDDELQPEGLAESVTVDAGERTPLRSIKLTAWQLPYSERLIGANAVLFGGQVLTEWRLSENWAATLGGTFHDFEQVDLIPPATAVSPTLVNAGLEYGTTNAVVVNPVTGLPEYRSEYRVVDAIAELRYGGFGPRWPLVLSANWIHNTSAFNSQKDGGQAEATVGRRQQAGDWAFDYRFWKVEREAFPSVFMDSVMVIQTNSLTHAVRARYTLHPQVEFTARYLTRRRLETTAPANRWQRHFQLDALYRF